MPGFTVEPLPQIGAVRLVVDATDDPDPDPTDRVQMLRLTVPPDDPDYFATIRKVRVRPTYDWDGEGAGQYGQPWEMFNGSDVWYDPEAPLDTPVWYMLETIGGSWSYLFGTAIDQRITGDTGEFETGIGGWTAYTGAALTHEVAAPIFGTGSLRVTATASPANTGVRASVKTAAVAGLMYGASVSVRPSASAQVRVGINWYTAGNVYLSTSYNPATVLDAGVTISETVRAVAPATTGFAEVRLLWTAPTAGQYVVADRFEVWGMGDPEDAAASQPVTLTSSITGVPGGWLSDPTRPASDVRLSLLPVDGCDVDAMLAGTSSGVIFASHTAEVRAGAGARFDVVEQSTPTPVTGLRKAATSTLTVATMSFTDRARIRTLTAPGSLLMLRLPDEFGIDDRYTDVADITEGALTADLRVPYRVIDLPYASASTPSGTISGVLGTRIGDLDRYTTWDDFDQAELTSIDLLHGAGSTLGVTP